MPKRFVVIAIAFVVVAAFTFAVITSSMSSSASTPAHSMPDGQTMPDSEMP